MSDIPGAKARTLTGHTSSGVAIDRTQPWPYARAFASDTQDLDVPPLPTGLGLMGNFETPAVETHLGLPGVNLVVRRKPREALIAPAPRLTMPKSIWDDFEEGLLPSPEKQQQRRMQAPPRFHDERLVRAQPRWPKPALDTPVAPSQLDRSLSTDDIAGARPRRLVSVEARHAGLRRKPPPSSVAWPTAKSKSFF